MSDKLMICGFGKNLMINQHMSEEIKNCANCNWQEKYSGVCCNGDSGHAGESVDDDFVCDEWEAEQ